MNKQQEAAENIDVLSCPICDKKFQQEVIEQHVHKCLFLNSLSSSQSKRNSSHLEESFHHKRTKIDTSPVSSTSSSNAHQSMKSKLSLKNKSISTHSNDHKNIPLAESMRPNCLDDIVGQSEAFGNGSMLHSMLVKKKIPNMILWGPPGCGKTSIANVISNICKEQNNMRFVKLSATMSGINDVKEAVKIAKNEAQYQRQTVMFMDEIHRFNKLQQDTFLPHVENGTITLVGATTENPSFSLNNALLSRCRVIVLNKLTIEEVWQILERAVIRNNLAVIVDNFDDGATSECDKEKYMIERKSIRWLAEICDGDARIALGALELVLNAGLSVSSHTSSRFISLEDMKNGIKRSHMVYDRQGEEHYNIASAIHKAVRAGDDNAALYWTTRALHAGEDPLYVARRLVRAAAEDIGLADPSALVEAVSCLQGCQQLGMPECDVLLAQCAVRLARADKSPAVYRAMRRVQRGLAEGPLPPVPLHLRNAPTKLMRDLGYGKGYNMLHRDESGLCYMPEGLENVNFFDEDAPG